MTSVLNDTLPFQIFQDPTLSTIQFQIEKSWIEIQNGLEASVIRFESTADLYSTIQETVSSLKTSPYKWCVDCFCCAVNESIFLCSFKTISTYKNTQSFFPTQTTVKEIVAQYPTFSTLEKAKLLFSLPIHMWTQLEKKVFLPLLMEEAHGPTRVLATLACEILLCWGMPTVPSQFVAAKNHTLLKKRSAISVPNGKAFEDRIDVTAYNYFESFHPSYARQCVALANQVVACAPQGGSRTCLDIGTGPGAALLMQTEMMPGYRFMAIEPSETAYRHLQQNIAACPNVEAFCIDFLSYRLNGRFSAIVSTGASHHLNTYAFMQKSSYLLEENGVFVIADEMISPYKTVSQRKLNVMLHHSVYILELLNKLQDLPTDSFEEKEQNACALLKNYIPLGFALAKLGLTTEAEHIYKELLERLHNLNLDANISQLFVGFYRLMYLEVEALVAGIDYEVEQKTYPEMLIKLGALAELECVYHECVHHTSSGGKQNSGTHVMAFKHAK